MFFHIFTKLRHIVTSDFPFSKIYKTIIFVIIAKLHQSRSCQELICLNSGRPNVLFKHNISTHFDWYVECLIFGTRFLWQVTVWANDAIAVLMKLCSGFLVMFEGDADCDIIFHLNVNLNWFPLPTVLFLLSYFVIR